MSTLGALTLISGKVEGRFCWAASANIGRGGEPLLLPSSMMLLELTTLAWMMLWSFFWSPPNFILPLSFSPRQRDALRHPLRQPASPPAATAAHSSAALPAARRHRGRGQQQQQLCAWDPLAQQQLPVPLPCWLRQDQPRRRRRRWDKGRVEGEDDHGAHSSQRKRVTILFVF